MTQEYAKIVADIFLIALLLNIVELKRSAISMRDGLKKMNQQKWKTIVTQPIWFYLTKIVKVIFFIIVYNCELNKIMI